MLVENYFWRVCFSETYVGANTGSFQVATRKTDNALGNTILNSREIPRIVSLVGAEISGGARGEFVSKRGLCCNCCSRCVSLSSTTSMKINTTKILSYDCICIRPSRTHLYEMINPNKSILSESWENNHRKRCCEIPLSEAPYTDSNINIFRYRHAPHEKEHMGTWGGRGGFNFPRFRRPPPACVSGGGAAG